MKRKVGPPFALTLLLFGLMHHAGARPATNWLAIPHAKLCITEGAIGQAAGNRLTVNVPKMRAFVTIATTQEVEARFTYLDQTRDASKLGSGEIRIQFGLKLHAPDPCNLVYAMWRIEPESKLVVSIKSNPGQHTSAECANRGYRNIKPARNSPVSALRSGSSHTLRAEVKDEELHVYADNNLVWQGSLGPECEASTARSASARITRTWNSNCSRGSRQAPIPTTNWPASPVPARLNSRWHSSWARP